MEENGRDNGEARSQPHANEFQRADVSALIAGPRAWTCESERVCVRAFACACACVKPVPYPAGADVADGDLDRPGLDKKHVVPVRPLHRPHHVPPRETHSGKDKAAEDNRAAKARRPT